MSDHVDPGNAAARAKTLKEFEESLQEFDWGCLAHGVSFSDLLAVMAEKCDEAYSYWQLSEYRNLPAGLRRIPLKEYLERSKEVADRLEDLTFSLASPSHCGFWFGEFLPAALYLAGFYSSLEQAHASTRWVEAEGPPSKAVKWVRAEHLLPPDAGKDLEEMTEEQMWVLLGRSQNLRCGQALREVVTILKNVEGEGVVHLSLASSKASISKKTSAFLKHVSRTYYYGFEVECLVMCRGALEAQFEAAVSPDDCLDVLGPRPVTQGGAAFTFADRVAVAVRKGLITSQLGETSRNIRQLGNQAVHELRVPPDCAVCDVIADTLRILECLGPD